MKTSILTFSPTGDTELILRRPNFRNYKESKEGSNNESTADGTAPKNEVVKLEDNKNEDGQTTEDESPVPDVYSDRSSSIYNTDDLRALEATDEKGHSVQICLRVSSAHLKLASPFFTAMLDGPFSEGIRNKDNLFELKALEWNAEALVILLDIIHGHHRGIPERVDLDMLIEVAKLCDYYQCEEIVEVFADRWVAAFDEDKGHEEEATIKWLFIAWVFHKAQTFNNQVAATLKYSTIPVQTDLPLPSTIIEKVEAKRLELINEVLDNLYGLHESLWVTDDNCDRDCASMLLGSLMKQMREAGLMPRPNGPLPSSLSSVMQLRGFVSGLKTPVRHIGVSWAASRNQECSFNNKTQPWMDHMGKTYMDGFRFQDFRGALNSQDMSESK